MDLRKNLLLIKTLLEKENISFALIGGLALAARGFVRATQDIDVLISENDKARAKQLLQKAGFAIVHETEEVIQFEGDAFIDILLARRPMSKKMLENASMVGDFPVKVLETEDLIGLKIQAYKNDPSREFQDKADIQNLIHANKDLDFKKIKEYADLFNEWIEIEKICKQK